MRRRSITAIIAFLITTLVFSNITWAQKAPDGFCGLKWGTIKEKIKEMLNSIPNIYLLDFEDWISFMPDFEKSDWGKIGEVKVTQYRFNFSESGKFYEGSVDFPKYTLECPNNFDILFKSLISKYGKPHKTIPLVLKINPNAKIGMHYEWTINNMIEITLWYDDMEKRGINGTLVYSYLPIKREVQKLKEKDVEKTKNKL